MTMVGGLTGADLKSLHGNHFLGWNANGVTYSSMHIDAEEIILREEMPGVVIDQIFASVARLQQSMKRRTKGGFIKGQIPTPLYFAWQKEWEKGPKQWGVIWHAFLNSKLLDRDYSKFLVRT